MGYRTAHPEAPAYTRLVIEEINSDKGKFFLLGGALFLVTMILAGVVTHRDSQWRIHTGIPFVSSPTFIRFWAQPQDREIFHHGRVYGASGDTVFARRAENGKEIWRYTLDNGYVFFTNPLLVDDRFFIGDSGGTLHAFNAQNGERVWSTATPDMLSSQGVTGGSAWFSNIVMIPAKIIVGGHAGVVMAFSQKDGSKLWERPLGSRVNALVYDEHTLVASGARGLLVRLSEDGTPLWEAPNASSQTYVTFGLKKGGFFRTPLVIVSQADGTVTARDVHTGQEAYTLSLAGSIVTPPVTHDGSLWLVTAGRDHRLTKIEIATGRIAWEHVQSVRLGSAPAVGCRNPLVAIIPMNILGSFCVRTLYVGDHEGVMLAIDDARGVVAWKFRSSGPIVSPAVVGSRHLRFGNANGDMYTLLVLDGKIPQKRGSHDFSITREEHEVGKNTISEFTITYPEDQFLAPWNDIQTEAVFSGNGKTVSMYGYYYDKDVWKIVFNPPSEGRWEYEIRFNFPDGDSLSQKGFLVSRSSSDIARLKTVYQSGGIGRLSEDGMRMFPALGIETTQMDFNANGNPLDDFTIGEATGSAGGRDQNHAVDDFMRLHSEGGRMFTIFRWGPNNASFGLSEDLIPGQNRTLLFEGKAADRLVRSAATHDLRVWMTLFEPGVPGETMWSASPLPSFLAKQYIRYVLARYGAFVSIWELTNEADTRDMVIEELVGYLKTIDQEKRPVSISWERPDLSVIDIVSPHWYANENPGSSDLALLTRMNAREASVSGKPVIFGELGNKTANWDVLSAARMRVRAWTAVMHGVGAIFWSTSGIKNYTPARSDMNGNQYIGREERATMRTVNTFVKDIGINAKQVVFESDTSVRGHGLVDTAGLWGYFLYVTDRSEKKSTVVSFQSPKSGTLSWHDAATGVLLGEAHVPAGRLDVVTPPFLLDIAVKIVFDE